MPELGGRGEEADSALPLLLAPPIFFTLRHHCSMIQNLFVAVVDLVKLREIFYAIFSLLYCFLDALDLDTFQSYFNSMNYSIEVASILFFLFLLSLVYQSCDYF